MPLPQSRMVCAALSAALEHLDPRLVLATNREANTPDLALEQLSGFPSFCPFSPSLVPRERGDRVGRLWSTVGYLAH